MPGKDHHHILNAMTVGPVHYAALLWGLVVPHTGTALKKRSVVGRIMNA